MRLDSKSQLFLYTALCLAFIVALRADDPDETENGTNGDDEAQKVDPLTGSIIPAERNLSHDLFAYGYDKTVRPAKTAKDIVNITMDLLLLRVVAMDEKTKTLTINCLLRKRWKDVQLQWRPSKYDSIKQIRVPINKIWKPDIVLYTNADDQYGYVYDDLALVTNDGTVQWVPQAKLKSFCYYLNLERFPYDKQRCDLIFGSWTHDMKAIDLHYATNVSAQFVFDGDEWDIEIYTVQRRVFDYMTSDQYPAIMYTILMRRTGVYYVNMFVWPAVILAFLTAFMFLVPPEAGERVHIGTAVILSSLLVLIMMNEHLPTEIGKFPVIGRYLQFDIIMATVAIILSTAVLNFHHRELRKGKVPDFLKKIFLGKLARMVFMRGEVYTALPSDISVTEASSELRYVNANDELGLDSSQPLPKSPTMALEKVLDEIRQYLKICASKAPALEPVQTHRQIVLNEWRQLALVVDRLLFCVYIFISILMAIIMLH